MYVLFGDQWAKENEANEAKGWYITPRHLCPLDSWCTAVFQGDGHGCTEREKAERDAACWEKVRSVVGGNVRSIQPALSTKIANPGLSEADDFWIASGEITVCPCEEQPYLAADKRCEFRPAHFEGASRKSMSKIKVVNLCTMEWLRNNRLKAWGSYERFRC